MEGQIYKEMTDIVCWEHEVFNSFVSKINFITSVVDKEIYEVRQISLDWLSIPINIKVFNGLSISFSIKVIHDVNVKDLIDIDDSIKV